MEGSSQGMDTGGYEVPVEESIPEPLHVPKTMRRT
jgi:hypothetical protein